MSDDHTPTTEEIRHYFAYPWSDRFEDEPVMLAGFDRWLTAHDAEVKASALKCDCGNCWICSSW